MNFNAFCSTDIEFADVYRFQEICTEADCRNILLIMSESAYIRYGFQNFLERLGKSHQFCWIKSSVSYPTQQTLLEAFQKIGDFCPEVIIAVGGGSAIDLAKGIKAFYHNKISDIDDVTKLLKGEIAARAADAFRIIAVPTTAGTGAELTRWATIWDRSGKEKYSIELEVLRPEKAVIVPELVRSGSSLLTVSAGLDALSHAMEAYWSRNTTPLVREMAGRAVSLVVKYLKRILAEPDSAIYWEKQCMASVLAGLAFSAAKTTACHSISYPLTMGFHIPHGIACAMSLVPVLNINHGSFPEEQELLELFSECGGVKGFLDSLCSDSISFLLRDHHVSRGDLRNLADRSFTLGRMDNNPVPFTKEMVYNLLLEIY